MEMGAREAMFGSYCYGPVDLVRMFKGDSTMWLLLRDPSGRAARAIYKECIYWCLDQDQVGSHLSLIRKVGAGELLARPNSEVLLALRKNATNVARLLREWEAAGLSFYLHVSTSPAAEYLVVARELDYKEMDERTGGMIL